MSAEVSSTRLYLGNLPRDVTKEDIQSHFKDGTGNITEIKLMNGFGFIEYDDALDARDVVPAFHGSDMNGSRLTVQFARGSRQRDFPAPDRETSWQDLKDFARRSGLDVVYSEVGRDRDGKGFVEFETAGDLKVAVDKLDNQDFKGASVRCLADTQDEVPRNDRYRSRSPPPFRRGGGGYPPSDGYYGRGPPPSRGYSPRRDEYRRRSPPRDDYYSRHSGYRSPPPPRAARPPVDDPYPPPARGGYRDDPYGAPPRRGYEDPYAANGYDRPRARSPPRAYGGYDERPPPPRYW
ncbi:MAG: hypothetical protein ASARMPREDX12_003807 [Alectoria sarmentosa]|nr:MAG: hypothetical protein ASARMPREDX12_003807 [Alectoria sarmentosa]